jgi:putative flippase GtrA
MSKVINHSSVRFILVGFANTACGVGSMMILLHGLKWGYWLSTLLGNGIAMILSYLLNSKWTFQSGRRNIKGLLLFVTVSLAVYSVSYPLSLWIGTKMFTGISISALLGSLFYTIFGYLGHRFITFR